MALKTWCNVLRELKKKNSNALLVLNYFSYGKKNRINHVTRHLVLCFVMCVYALSRSVRSDSWKPHALQPASLLCPWNFQARMLEMVAILFSRGSSWLRDQTQVSRIAGGFFNIWANREALKILKWVSVSLLPWIFLTQESNRGLLHCRHVLYHLSHLGSSVFFHRWLYLFQHPRPYTIN